MATATGYHCGQCGMSVDSTGVTHTAPNGVTSTPGHTPRPVPNNWPLVRS